MGFKISVVIVLIAVALVVMPIFLKNALPLAQKFQKEAAQYVPTFLVVRPPSGASVGEGNAYQQAGGKAAGEESRIAAPRPAEETRGVVTLSSVYRSQLGYSLSLYSHTAQGKTVDITGWTIKTNRGEIKIPQAVNIYMPDYVAAPTNIVLEQGHAVYISSGQSPLYNYINFRTNLCTGYLNRQHAFSPALPNTCPVPSRASYQSYPGWCQSYIMSLPSCGAPDEKITSAWDGYEGYLCRKFIDGYFNFSSCVRNSISKPDFLGNRWYVWTAGGLSPFDDQHDWVRLYNKDGVLIDEYIY